MNIRKADSKGRLTGFVPDTYYWTEERGSTIAVFPVDEPEQQGFISGPREAAREHLRAWRERRECHVN